MKKLSLALLALYLFVVAAFTPQASADALIVRNSDDGDYTQSVLVTEDGKFLLTGYKQLLPEANEVVRYPFARMVDAKGNVLWETVAESVAAWDVFDYASIVDEQIYILRRMAGEARDMWKHSITLLSLDGTMLEEFALPEWVRDAAFDGEDIYAIGQRSSSESENQSLPIPIVGRFDLSGNPAWKWDAGLWLDSLSANSKSKGRIDPPTYFASAKGGLLLYTFYLAPSESITKGMMIVINKDGETSFVYRSSGEYDYITDVYQLPGGDIVGVGSRSISNHEEANFFFHVDSEGNIYTEETIFVNEETRLTDIIEAEEGFWVLGKTIAEGKPVVMRLDALGRPVFQGYYDGKYEYGLFVGMGSNGDPLVLCYTRDEYRKWYIIGLDSLLRDAGE